MEDFSSKKRPLEKCIIESMPEDPTSVLELNFKVQNLTTMSDVLDFILISNFKNDEDWVSIEKYCECIFSVILGHVHIKVNKAFIYLSILRILNIFIKISNAEMIKRNGSSEKLILNVQSSDGKTLQIDCQDSYYEIIKYDTPNKTDDHVIKKLIKKSIPNIKIKFDWNLEEEDDGSIIEIYHEDYNWSILPSIKLIHNQYIEFNEGLVFDLKSQGFLNFFKNPHFPKIPSYHSVIPKFGTFSQEYLSYNLNRFYLDSELETPYQIHEKYKNQQNDEWQNNYLSQKIPFDEWMDKLIKNSCASISQLAFNMCFFLIIFLTISLTIKFKQKVIFYFLV